MRRRLSEAEARARRDKIALWAFLAGTAALAAGYVAADFAGVVPRELSVRWRSGMRFDNVWQGRFDDLDPARFLGIPIGETRYRLNFAEHVAIVTRPLSGVREWRIPERVEYGGESFEVTALDSFAFLNAAGVTHISLPPTLRYVNGAEQGINAELETLELRLPGGGAAPFPKGAGFDGAALRRALGTEEARP